jgi:excisionase family DNA binding protein
VSPAELEQLANLIAGRLAESRLIAYVFTTKEAAAYLKVSHQYLEIARVKGGGPPYVKLSRAVRYRRQDLDTWLGTCVRSHT